MAATGSAQPFLIDAELWKKTRSGARSGRGFRYQDAVATWLTVLAWRGDAAWTHLIPEGIDDLTLHGPEYEFRAQLKARHDPHGTFTQLEAARHLAKSAKDLPSDWLKKPRIRLALVLERPIEGIEHTGWQVSLADSGQELSKFESLLSDALGPHETGLVEALLAHIHLVVETDPLEQGCKALTNAPLPPAGVRLALQQLREKAGHAADSNYSASSEAPITLDRSDVQMRIDGVHGVIDPNGYLALTAGLAELADFGAPMPAAGFYKGINVAPGHVGSGLVFARPELMTDVLSGLEAKRFTLVAGPSGAGKSALAWLSAHHTRHAVRWYRVRELQSTDVAKLVQLAKLLEAEPNRPVGFVIDDVGRQETAGWDTLVREVEAHAGILAIGTVREEDLFTLSTAARTPTVRPTLDEDLANRIWKTLQASDSVAFSHWQEPFELSKGLLLEYTHLLTAGQRLEETIREQVRRRLAEGRSGELTLLRTISFAAAQGAAVDPHLLQTLSGLDEFQFAAALQRLIDEHAVRAQPNGTLSGLHEIRSTYLDEAIREILYEPRSKAVSAAAETLSASTFAAFIVRVLRRWPEEETALLEGLTARFRPSQKDCWIPIVYGLGLATADRIAERWLEISRSTGIDDRLSSFTFMLTLAKPELGGLDMFAKVIEAQAVFAKVDVPDLRKTLFEKMAGSWCPSPLDVNDINELTAALLPITGCKYPPSVSCVPEGSLADEPLDELIALLTTLREVDLETAQKVVDAAGGSEVLLDRIYNETPWVTRPVIGQVEGKCSVTGYIRFIHPEIQPDLNAEVVRLCAAMAAAVPNAELLISDALFPNGHPVGYRDQSINRKRMPRQALVAPARVAWNRAQGRAIHRLIAAPTETQRATSLAQAIKEIGLKLREAGDFYCRMETPGQKWKLFLQVRNWLTTFIQPPSIEDAISGPLEMGQLSDSDKPHSFVTGLQQLMDELTNGVSEKPLLMAVRTADLARDAEALLRPEAWRMTSEPPLETLAHVRDTLWDIHAVLADTATAPERRSSAATRFRTMSRRNSILQRAAMEAHLRAESTLAARRKEIQIAMAMHGLDVEVYSRPRAENRGFYWPNAEFAILLKVSALADWFATEAIFTSAAADLESISKISYGAVICGHLAPFGLTFISSTFPNLDFANEWADDLPYQPIRDESLSLYDETFEAISTMSAVCAESGRELNSTELEFLTSLLERYSQNIKLIEENLTDAPDEALLIEAADSLIRAFDRFKSEVVDENHGALASELSSSLSGTMSDLALEVLCVRLALMESVAFRATETTPQI
ncbi:hypothetical protein IF690_24515 [Pseudomonas sp. SK3(2021)]|uniref:hypothetical protein n=1 Tax=Pseudomonas sp. SK3(2021) TaxID=2841064 RepID=UPI00192B3198|nr:hypothetical protein [Pseudomonas sp. SK3(2021)]QQZ41136.1 hypothetical protein IF690_24515 [Pseudomonas sp. SK3(2021)]